MTIHCTKHGSYEQLGHDHLRGHGCGKCGDEARAAALRFSTADFIERARLVHGDRYSYAHADYLGADIEVLLECPVHGIFPQVAISHTRGSGCDSCVRQQAADRKRMTTGDFVSRAVAVHGDAYDYTDTVYEQYHRRLSFRCKSCARVVRRSPAQHLAGSGCTRCSETAGERAVRAVLEEAGVDFIAQFTHDDLRYKGKLRVDFAVPGLLLAIEFDGPQHRDPVMAWGATTAEEAQKRLVLQQARDAAKDAWSVRHGWTLVRLASVDAVSENLVPLLQFD